MSKLISKHGWVLGAFLGVLVSCGGDEPQQAPAADENTPAQSQTEEKKAETPASVTPLSKIAGTIELANPVVLNRADSTGEFTNYENKWFTGSRAKCKIQVSIRTSEYNGERVTFKGGPLMANQVIQAVDVQVSGQPKRYSNIRLEDKDMVISGMKSAKVTRYIQCYHIDPQLESLTIEDVLEAFGGSQAVSLIPPAVQVN